MNETKTGPEKSTGGEQPASRTAAVAQLALERMSLFLAVLGFALLLVKVMRVSHLNSRTAHALVSHVGPVEILMGTLVTHFPMILFVVSLLVTWWGTGSLAVLRSPSAGHAAAAALVVLALLLLPWPFVVVLLAAGFLRFFHQRSRAEPDQRRLAYYLLLGGVAVLLLADAEPWLPSERFVLQDGTEFVGYSIAEATHSGGWTVVLIDEDRRVDHVLVDTIAEREPCHPPGEDNELEDLPSLLQVVIGESADLPEPECE